MLGAAGQTGYVSQEVLFPVSAVRHSRRSTPRPPGRVLTRVLAGVVAATAVAPALALASTLSADAATGPVRVAALQLPAASSVGAASTARPPMRASRGGARTPVPGSFTGLASWYGGSFQGRLTANGERFDTRDLTAASKTLPFGTRLRVCRVGRCVVVRINDRGPYVGTRVLDLSQAAAQALGYDGVEVVTATPLGTAPPS